MDQLSCIDIRPETGQRRDYGPLVIPESGISFTVSWCAPLCRMRTFRSPVAGLSLRRFAFLFLSFSRSRRPLALSLAPPPSPSDQRARVRALCSPGCSLALSHPQCAHRTRPGRKSFPLRVARTTHVFRLSRSTGDRHRDVHSSSSTHGEDILMDRA